jgi:tetratricopeptide (TPR) repeat protein
MNSERSIRQQVERILSDDRFRSAQRASQFLKWVVDKSLAGDTAEIKESVLAMEVYNRPPSYDPKSDSIVRVEAGRLREKLARYYETSGRQDPIRISIPKGAYVPAFESRRHDTLRTGIVPRWLLAALFLPAVALSGWIVSSVGAAPTKEAIDAWREGVSLIAQDPLTSGAESGMPVSLHRAIDRLEYSVGRAPSFAKAWSSLAESYDYAASFRGRDVRDDADRAIAAARRSIALDPGWAHGHAIHAAILADLFLDFAGAEREYHRAIELDSTDEHARCGYADLLRITGRTEIAARLLAGWRIDLPASAAIAAKQAEIQADLGDFDAAEAAAGESLRLKRNYRRARLAHGFIQERRGQFAAAAREYESVLQQDPDDRRALPAYGYVLGRMGRHHEARPVLERMLRMHERTRNMAYHLAVVHAGSGDRSSALDWIGKAHASGHRMIAFALVDSRLNLLRDDPAFQRIVADVRGTSPGR